MNFADISNVDDLLKVNVTVLANKNAFGFVTTIRPGVVKFSTELFTGVDDDILFDKVRKYVQDVLRKIYDVK
jgi:hypothetical protein